MIWNISKITKSIVTKALSVLPHLCIDDGRHPEPLGRSWHRQHCPKKDEDWQHQWDDRGCHQVIEHNNEITDQLWVGRQNIIERKEQLQQSVLRRVEFTTLYQLLNTERPGTENTETITKLQKLFLHKKWSLFNNNINTQFLH